MRLAMVNMKRLRLPWFGLALLLGACAQPSHYHREDYALPAQWQQQDALAAAPSSGPWWRGFHDPALDALVESVLAANTDLHVAGLRLRGARLAADQADTNLTPGVNASLDANGNKNLKSGVSSHSMGPTLTVSYELDLWGKLAAVRDQASWEAAASAEDLAATRQSLIRQALQQYWQLGYLNSAITLGERQLANLSETLRLTRVKYEAGAVPRLDLVQASAQLAGKQAAQANLRSQRVAASNALLQLLGRNRGPVPFEPKGLPLTPIPAIAVGIPADLLARRPDVKAAELRLRKTLARGDEVRTSFYPALTLTGSASTASDRLAQVLENPVGSLGAALTLPFLEYNNNRIAVASSENDYQIAQAEFRQRLFDALFEVENALAARHYGEAQLTRLTQQQGYAIEADRLARVRYEAGNSPVQEWLDEQNRRWDAELALLAQQQSQLNTMADLYLALGGRDDPARDAPAQAQAATP